MLKENRSLLRMPLPRAFWISKQCRDCEPLIYGRRQLRLLTLSGDADPVDRPMHLEPRPTGTICRVVEFPPDAAWQDRTDASEVFSSMEAGHAADSTSSTPMMHKTASVDYAIVLSGEMWAVMEEGETCMRAGDVLIQRATNHAWSNRSAEPALVAFVLVGAQSG